MSWHAFDSTSLGYAAAAACQRLPVHYLPDNNAQPHAIVRCLHAMNELQRVDASCWVFLQDCATGVCSGGICRQAATCTNRVRDDNEGDVDCGQVCDRQCGVGGTCQVDGDCISGVCRNGRCLDAPTCSNNIKDGRETGASG